MRQGEISVTVNPVVDMGAQATIMGDEHLIKTGHDISTLHPIKVTMDCANDSKLDAYGVFLGYIRAECKTTCNTLVHRGMVLW